MGMTKRPQKLQSHPNLSENKLGWLFLLDYFFIYR